MFVRWKKRNRLHGAGYSFDAVLVEGKRRGKTVEQRFVKHLSSIRQRGMDTVESRTYFWVRAERALDSLGLQKKLRNALESQLSSKVPRPKQSNRRKEPQ